MPWITRDRNFNQLMGKEKHAFAYWQLISWILRLVWRLGSTRASSSLLFCSEKHRELHSPLPTLRPLTLKNRHTAEEPIRVLSADTHYVHLVGVLWVTWEPAWVDDKQQSDRDFMNCWILISKAAPQSITQSWTFLGYKITLHQYMTENL